jgi:hypothetical protein
MSLPFANTASADQRDQVRRVHGTPAALGGLDELERHRDPGGARAGSLGDPLAEPHGGEGRRDRIGGAQVDPTQLRPVPDPGPTALGMGLFSGSNGWIAATPRQGRAARPWSGCRSGRSPWRGIVPNHTRRCEPTSYRGVGSVSHRAGRPGTSVHSYVLTFQIAARMVALVRNVPPSGGPTSFTWGSPPSTV